MFSGKKKYRHRTNLQRAFERLESRRVLSTDLVISEVLASNNDAYRDFDNDTSDFFEVHNRGSQNIDLMGWHFTDDLTDTTKWQVPLSTVLAPDSRIVVFASNKDLVGENNELHTNFQLSRGGESVGLADPDGQLVYHLTYPRQVSDVSYGLEENIQVVSLVEAGDPARSFVPLDDALGTTWTGGNEPFSDGSWRAGASGIGYESSAVGGPISRPVAYWAFDELLQGGTIAPDELERYDGMVSGATLTTGGQGKTGEALRFDGDGDYVLPGVISELVNSASFTISLWFRRAVDDSANATNHAVSNVLIAQSSSGANDVLEIGTAADSVDVYLDTAELGGSIPPISQTAGIQNDTWHHLVVTYDSRVADELKLFVDGALAGQYQQYGGLVSPGGTSPFTIGLSRPGQAEWGDFSGHIDDLAVWDSALDWAQVTALFDGTSPLFVSGYADWIELDLASQLYQQNSSAYIRMPFVASSPESFDLLKLRMHYDDAFVAYLNGVEVSRAGLTGTPLFNSSADANRDDREAFLAEEFFLSNPPGLLVDGQNILAIQLLNLNASEARALVLPELDGIDLPFTRLLVDQGAAATAWIPSDDSLHTTWTGGNEPFDESAWISGKTGVGYDSVSADPAGGPLAYWSFDTLTGGGTIAPDATGNHDGSVVGATLTTGGLGRLGEALLLDGENDSVSPGVIPEFIGHSAFTTSAWFRRTGETAGATNHSVNNVLFAQSSAGSKDVLEIGTEGDFIEVYLDTDDLGGAEPPVRRQVPLLNDTWHHLVVTYDSGDAEELKIYFDGTLVHAASQYGGKVSDGGSSPLAIGLARPGQDEWGDFIGLIDDVAVWDEALTAPQVAALFGGTSPLLLSGYHDQIGLDLESLMSGPTSSALVRVPFTVSNPHDIVSLQLKMQYDDAFVAYLNGTEVARAGITGTLSWDSTADSDRPDIDGLTPQEFFIPHTSELLQAGTNILAIQVVHHSVSAERLLAMPRLEAVPVPDKLFSFMETPTPGTANGQGLVGVVKDTSFSVDRGFYDDPFTVAITTETGGAEIRYTLDGSLPSSPTSLVYGQPILITTTTMLRAAAYQPGLVPTNVDTQTYLFLDDVLTQTGADFPATWGTFRADYEMDPNVVNDATYSATIRNDLKSLPTLSLISDEDSWFNPSSDSSVGGIFAHTDRRGIAWERPLSVELIQADGSDGFQINAGIRVHGGGSRSLSSQPKTTFRLEFRGEYGDTSLNYPLFGPSATDRFDTLVLRATYDDAWSGGGRAESTYLRDPWLAETQLAMEQISTHSQFVHMYINGLYWGVYNIVERPDGDFGASYLGGDKEDYDSITAPAHSVAEASDGNLIAYNAAKSIANSGLYNNEQFAAIQEYIDVPNLIDYMIMNLFGGNIHWPSNNWAMLRRRLPGEGFQFITWDGEGVFRDTYTNQTGVNNPHGPAFFYSALRQNNEFRVLFGDHVHRHLFNDGVLTPQAAALQWNELADKIRSPLVAESARWGDFRGEPPFSPDGVWTSVHNRVLDIIAQRTAITLNQFRSASLYPSVDAPSFSQHGGTITADLLIDITNEHGNGTIYFTSDGQDPRLEGGNIFPAAQIYSESIPLSVATTIKARVYADGQWSALNEATFTAPVLDFVITEINYNPHSPTAAELAVMPNLDNDDFEFVELHNTTDAPIDLAGMQLSQVDVNGDQQGIDFTFSLQMLDPNERIVIVENHAAFQLRYGTGVRIAAGDDTLGGPNGEYGSRLSNAGERLLLKDSSGITVHNFDYNDRGNWPQRADGDGSTLEVVDSTQPLNDPLNWTPSVKYGGTPGSSSISPAQGVVINEILTHTDLPNVDVVELYNPTASPISIDGWWLSDNANNLDKYVIAGGHTVPAGGYLLLDQDDFMFGFNSTLGEQVWLVQSDDSGNPDLIVDQFEFGAAEIGVTFGRWPNATGELVPMVSNTLGAANSGPRFGPVVISEVMYHGTTSTFGIDPQQLEFVEIYNPSPQTVDLSNWRIDGIGFDFPVGSSIGPGKTLVIVPFDPLNDGTAVVNFRSIYAVNIPANQSQYLGPYPGQLDNGGERITLLRADDPRPEASTTIPLVIEDYVDYDDAAPWATDADGSGDSLNRELVDLWGNDPTSWINTAPEPGAFGPSLRRTYHNADQETSVIGEVGTVSDVTHAGQVVVLGNTFNNPVIFARPASYNESDAVAVRVSDIQSDRFTLRLEEPTNEDGQHAGETVSYIVLKKGTHELPDGTSLEVGTVSTTATVGLFTSHQWETVSFSSSFQDIPVVLTQIQTDNGLDYLNSRQRQVNEAEFEVALESQENVAAQQPEETIGYMALEAGSGTWDGLTYEAGTTDRVFSHNFSALNFSNTFATPPTLVANISGLNENNNAVLRYRNLGNSNVELKIKEDASFDVEENHATEKVSYVALDGQGLLTAAGAQISDGQTRMFTVSVPDTGSVADVNVSLEIDHTHTADLDVFLIGPDNTSVELFTGVGGAGTNFNETVLDDEAIIPISSGTAPFTGRFQPKQPLSDFNGRAITGTWTLEVTDHSSGGLLQAPLLLADSFDYGATSGSLDTSSGGVWGGADGDTIYDAGTNLTYPGYTSTAGSGKMATGTNTAATVVHSDPGGISDVQNVPGTYYASALVNGKIDWWVRLGTFLVKHGTDGNSNILYGLSGPTDQLLDTGADIGSDPNASDLIVVKITSQAGSDEMRVVVNPDLNNLTMVEAALNSATPVIDKDMSNGDEMTFTQFSRESGLPSAWFDELRFGTTLAEVITGIPGTGGGGLSTGDFGTLRDWSIEIDSISVPTGNLNFDSAIDGRDVDLMYANVGQDNPLFDLTGNGVVDQADVDYLVQTILGTRYGDTDLDGDVDTGDLTRAIIHFNGAGGSGKFWADGETDGDGDVDTRDLTRAIINFTGALADGQSTVVAVGHRVITGELSAREVTPGMVDLSTTTRTAKRTTVNDQYVSLTTTSTHPVQLTRVLAGGATRKQVSTHPSIFQSESDWLADG